MKKILMLALAYFSCTVDAGFASGQEMLQYHAAFGAWGVAGAAVTMIVMPLTAMIESLPRSRPNGLQDSWTTPSCSRSFA
ncbi:hypothetical protein ACL1IW_10045 [Corynebacterium striatum]